MAYEGAIAAVSRTIIGLIEENCPRDGLQHPQFDLYHASQIDEPMAEGFSLLLYRIARDPALRNAPPRRTADGTTFAPSVPLDLYYVLTPWAKDAELQQRLLGWAIRFFEDMPVLPSGALAAYDNAPDGPSFQPQESVEFTLDTLQLADFWNLWDKLKPKLQTSLTYVARVVALDSRRPLIEAGPAQTREFRVGPLEFP